MSFRERILQLLELPEEGTLTLAFSGGSDSLALASLLPGERTRCVYINHNIRSHEELEREAALNRRNCERLGLPLEIITIPENKVKTLAREEKMGTEAAARRLRYEALSSAADGWILTAHHLDDQAETVIMRMISGSPLYKMEGIAGRNGRILRPMLRVPKEWIMGLLEEERLEWSVDSTNSDTDYARNAIRHGIIPHLTIEEKQALSRIADNVRAMNARSSGIGYTKGRYYSFSREEYLSANELRREEVFYNINRDENLPERLSRGETERFSCAIERGQSLDSSRFSIRIVKGEVRVYPGMPDTVHPADGDLSADGFDLIFSDEPQDRLTLRFDPSRVAPPLIIRTSREMDRMVLKEGTKTVRELEKEWKVPYSLVLEDRNGIAAVFARFLGGKDRLSERFLGSGEKYVFVE